MRSVELRHYRELRKLTHALAAGAAVASVLDAPRGGAKRDLQAKLEHLGGLEKASQQQAWMVEQLQLVIKDWTTCLAFTRRKPRRLSAGAPGDHEAPEGRNGGAWGRPELK